MSGIKTAPMYDCYQPQLAQHKQLSADSMLQAKDEAKARRVLVTGVSKRLDHGSTLRLPSRGATDGITASVCIV